MDNKVVIIGTVVIGLYLLKKNKQKAAVTPIAQDKVVLGQDQVFYPGGDPNWNSGSWEQPQ